MNRISFSIFGLFLLLTYRDLFYGVSRGADADVQNKHNLAKNSEPSIIYASNNKEDVIINSPHRHEPQEARIRFEFCLSCGYRQAYEQHKQFLLNQFSNLRIEGEIHQPSWLKYQIGSFIWIFKFIAMFMIYLELNPFTRLQMETPSIWYRAVSHKLYSIAIIFFVANAIEGNLMSTGGFEIFYNDIPIWSKLETGRIPRPEDLYSIVKAQQSFDTPDNINRST